MKNVLVAGANGFLGRNLVRRLLDNDCVVTALGSRFDDELLRKTKCVYVNDKQMDEIAVMLSGQSYDCFFDLAWKGTSGPLRADYSIQLDNARMTCDYVMLAARINCPRFLYASSINEMETYEYLQSDGAKPSGGYLYGIGKLAAHLMGQTVAYQNGVEFIPVVITNVYGAGEKSARLICSSICKLIIGERCSFTAGEQTYDFVYIDDAVNSIIAVAEKGKAFSRYYIGSGEPRPLREFLIEMRNIVAPNAEIGLGDVPFNGADISYEQFDLKKVERDTGYRNQVPFREGIQATTENIRSAVDDQS